MNALASKPIPKESSLLLNHQQHQGSGRSFWNQIWTRLFPCCMTRISYKNNPNTESTQAMVQLDSTSSIDLKKLKKQRALKSVRIYSL